MTMKKILQKLNSIRLCMEAHPDNEPDSEFADRIEDLKELPKMIEEYTKNLELQIDVILSGSSYDLQHEYSDKWISVKDELPTQGDSVLVCLKNKHVFQMGFDGIQFFLINGTGTVASVNNPVTHWMNLPQPPKFTCEYCGNDEHLEFRNETETHGDICVNCAENLY